MAKKKISKIIVAIIVVMAVIFLSSCTVAFFTDKVFLSNIFSVLRKSYLANYDSENFQFWPDSLHAEKENVVSVDFLKLSEEEILARYDSANLKAIVTDTTINSETVYAWYEKDPSDPSKYKMYIASKNIIHFPKDSSKMFKDFTNLKIVNFNNDITTKNTENINQMFMNDVVLERINGIETIDTNKLIAIHGLFENCRSITSLDLSAWNTANIADMDSAFREMVSLQTINLSGWNTEKVIAMYGMFLGDSSLKELDLSSFKTPLVNDFRFMFQHMTSLENLNASNMEISAAVEIDGMFQDIPNAKIINISSMDFPNANQLTNDNFLFGDNASNNNVKLILKDCNNADWLLAKAYIIDLPSTWGSANFMTKEGTYCSKHNAYTINLNSASISTIAASVRTITYEKMDDTTIKQNIELAKNASLWNDNLTDTAKEGEEVYGYATKSDINPALYDIHIVSVADNIYFPEDSSQMFKSFANNLVEVDLGTVKTDLVSYFGLMFYWCTKLETIKGIENLNTSSMISMSWMFQNCSSLTSLDLSKWDVSNLTNDLYGPWSGCSSLTNLNISTWDVSKIKIFDELVHGATSLTSLDISDWNMSSAESMVNMFTNSGIISLDLSKWDTSNVTNMDSTFREMHSLQSINLSGWNTEKVTKMSGMFLGTDALKELDLSSFKTPSVSNFLYVFQHMTSLENLNASNMTLTSATDISSLFQDIPNVKNLNISSMDFPNATKLTVYTALFGDNTSNSNIKIILKNCKNADWLLNNAVVVGLPDSWGSANFITKLGTVCSNHNSYTVNLNGSSISTIEASVRTITFEKMDAATIQQNIEIAKNASLWNDNLTDTSKVGEEVYGYATVSDVDPALYDVHIVSIADDIYFPPYSNNMFRSFANNLVEVDLGIAKMDFVIETGTMFYGCTKLKNIKGIETIDTSSMTSINWMFQNCSSLTSLDLSKWDISNLNGELYGPFSGCSSLTNLNISTWDVSKIRMFDQLVYGTSSLSSVDIENWNMSSAESMVNMFTNSGITSLDLSKWDTSNVTNMDSTFREMHSLQTINLSGWNTEKVTNMSGMFLGTNALKELDLSSFKTPAVSNFLYAFQHMTSLEYLNASNMTISSALEMTAMFQDLPNAKVIDISSMDFTNSNPSLVVNNIFLDNTDQVKVKLSSCSDMQWLLNHLNAGYDMPYSWTKNVFEYPDSCPTPTYDVAKMDIISSDLLTFTNKSQVSNATVKITSKTRDVPDEMYAKIKLQGTSSLSYEKKNYNITFYADKNYMNKQDIIVNDEWGGQNKYCLKANWIDSTQARNVVTAKLASEVQNKYGLFPGTPNNGLIDGFFVELYVNGEYLGLYTMNIPKDDWMFGMDKKNENHIVFAAENGNQHSAATFESLAEVADGVDFSIEVGPKDTPEEVASTFAKLNRLIAFVKDSTNEEFKAHISEYMNMDALLNYYVIMFISGGVDNMSKNMLLATYDGEIWYPSLYDLDTTWGIYFAGDGLYPTDLHPTNYLGGANVLFKKLVENFPQEVQTRYREIRQILTKEHIISEFETFMNTASPEMWQREHEKWPGIPSLAYTLEDQIKPYVNDHLIFTDSVMDQLYIQKKTYSDSRIKFDLENPYLGSNYKFIDTGINIYENEATNYTIFFQIKSSPENSEQTIFSNRNNNNAGMVVKSDYENKDDYQRYFFGESIDNKNYAALYKPSSSEYINTVIVKDGDNYTVYYGTLINKNFVSNPMGDNSVSSNVIIGANYDKTANTYSDYYKGSINKFTIYEGILSESEIEDLLKN